MVGNTYDAVIGGARCAGSATARLLAQQGVRTLVVDRATFPSDTVSTHCISGAGVVLLQRWGLFEDVKATNVPHVLTMGACLGSMDLPEAPAPSTIGTISPRRTVLDKLLVDRAREAAAEVREGVTVKDLLWDDAHERVTGIAGQAAGGGGFEARAPIVIGADGLHSFVAKAVGAELQDERPSYGSGCYAYFSGCETDRPNLAFNDLHFGFAFPTNDGQLCLGTGTEDKRLNELIAGGDEALLANLEKANPRLADDLRRGTRESRWHTFRAQPGRKYKPYGPGWALVGDAGYYKDPVTGLGIGDAFLAAQLVSDAVVAGGGWDEGALRHYHEQRDAIAGDLFELTHRLAALEWTNDDLLGLFGSFGAEVGRVTTEVAALP